MASWLKGVTPQIRLACPYCYKKFPRWRIQFQCTGRPSRSGQQCAPGNDTAYASNFGAGGLRLPVFSSWHGREADCPHCGADTTRRVCPECHHRLPTQFGRVRGRLVALVGARDTGKTVLLTVLMHELNNRAGDRLGTGVWGADEDTRLVFADQYERRLYNRKELHEPTRPVATASGLRAPLVFALGTERHGLRPPRRTLLSFFDTAGEDLQSESGVELNTRYLSSADAVLVVLDPSQRAAADANAMAGASTAGVVDSFQVLEKITDLLQSGKGSLKIRKPIAVAFSKMDLYWDDLPSTSPLLRKEQDVPGFDASDGTDVHIEVARLLEEWEGPKIERFLRSNYRRYHFFGFSALGARPDGIRVSAAGIQPYRVVDPFLWLLAELGAVPTIGRR